MNAILLACSASWLVLHSTGFRRTWPWRVALLVDGGARDIPRSGRHGAVRRASPPYRQRHRTRTDGMMMRSLAFTSDLLLVAISAGHSIHSGIEAVSGFDDGPAGIALGDAWHQFVGGSVLADELRRLPRIHGETIRPLVDTLVIGLASGAPLEPALHRLADRQRTAVRRRTEQRVRRLPILLLGPLVMFVLPSFVLLAIVPVVIVTAQGAGL